MVEVVAALIRNGDKFMICQRPESKTRGLLWEFVGGKVEPNETKEEALIRECHEELDVSVDVGSVFYDVVHEYPDITVHLTLFNASIAEGEPKKLEHNDIKWITPNEIAEHEFCPADKEILEKITREYSMQTACDFLKKAGVYYLATVEEDQPRVRPFGTVNIFENKLYIQTGKIKPTAKQLEANPKAEICAFIEGEWIRLSGKLVLDDRFEAKKSMLDAYPNLRSMYDENDGNTAVYYFENAEAVISAFTHAPVVLKF